MDELVKKPKRHISIPCWRPAKLDFSACFFVRLYPVIEQLHIYPHADPHRGVHSDYWGVSTELSERLHRVGPATHYRVSVCVPGGTLLPVHLRDRGGRALPLLCHRHQIQQWHTWEGVLHGQGPDGESPLKKFSPSVCCWIRTP